MSSFADLGPRSASALVLLAVAGGALWAGGPWFAALVLAAFAAMIGEMASLGQARGGTVLHGLLAALAGGAGFWLASAEGLALLPLPALPALVLAFSLRRERLWLPLYALAAGLVAWHLAAWRLVYGPWPLLWLFGVVIASDIAGYLAGRLIGGPKFWPKISPKKTWSGTVAGWLAAAAVGAVFSAPLGGPTAVLMLVSALLAFAGQMGDIAESALKRRAGVKDSSQLIPGHGGVLDRLDALLGAALAFALLAALIRWAMGV